MNNEVALLTEDIGLFLGALAKQARGKLTLVAPFIKQVALERLIGGIDSSVRLTVLTRWRVDEICAGVSDLSVFDLVRDRPGSRMLLHPRLHAKVLLVDDIKAAVGSANITDSALGFTAHPNAEVMVSLQPVPNRLFLFLMRLERESVPASEELRRQFEEAVKAGPPPPDFPVVRIPEAAVDGVMPLFPRFRSPEWLYRGYISVVEFNDRETRSVILDDLEALALPDGLDEPAFTQRVGAGLLALEQVRAFDELVSQPRYFGEMAEWLKGRGVLADQSQEDRKRYLQTLVRWLRHFLPGRYRLEEPKYSELFGRVEGWPQR
jgi:hypothetical protein